jgi:Zn-dependent membrane protease YugP
LPVEYDASHRALTWLEKKLTQQEHEGAKDALTWAARTYVVAALGSIATLLYYVSIYMEAAAEEIRQLEKVNLIISSVWINRLVL